jgi:hypothetical protein
VVLLALDTKHQICIAHSEELISITVELFSSVENEEDFQCRIECDDSEYSSTTYAALIGKAVSGVRVAQLDVEASSLQIKTSSGERSLSPKALDRPRETVLIFRLEDGQQLVFSSTMLDAPNNFAITMDDRFEVPCHDVLRIGDV